MGFTIEKWHVNGVLTTENDQIKIHHNTGTGHSSIKVWSEYGKPIQASWHGEREIQYTTDRGRTFITNGDGYREIK